MAAGGPVSSGWAEQWDGLTGRGWDLAQWVERWNGLRRYEWVARGWAVAEGVERWNGLGRYGWTAPQVPSRVGGANTKGITWSGIHQVLGTLGASKVGGGAVLKFTDRN